MSKIRRREHVKNLSLIKTKNQTHTSTTFTRIVTITLRRFRYTRQMYGKLLTETCQSRNSLTERHKQAHTTALERGDVRKRRTIQCGSGSGGGSGGGGGGMRRVH